MKNESRLASVRVNVDMSDVPALLLKLNELLADKVTELKTSVSCAANILEEKRFQSVPELTEEVREQLSAIATLSETVEQITKGYLTQFAEGDPQEVQDLQPQDISEEEREKILERAVGELKDFQDLRSKLEHEMEHHHRFGMNSDSSERVDLEGGNDG